MADIHIRECLVSTLGLMGKHQLHNPHYWWFTPKGGGHQMGDTYSPTSLDGWWGGWDRYEGYVYRYMCPGEISVNLRSHRNG